MWVVVAGRDGVDSRNARTDVDVDLCDGNVTQCDLSAAQVLYWGI